MRTNNHCPHCGESNGAKGDFCPRCGKAYKEPVVNSDDVATKENEEGNVDRALSRTWKVLLPIFLAVLIALALVLLLKGCACNRCDDEVKESIVNTTAPATVTPEPNPDPVNNGLDYPMETWLFVEAGTVISADIAVYEGDNNNLKQPIYDSLEGTADIIYFAADIHVWLEWGGHVIENATADQIVALINNKLTSYPTVRYFPKYHKMGGVNFVPYTNNVDVDDINAVTTFVITENEDTTE